MDKASKAKYWGNMVKPFCGPEHRRSFTQLALTLSVYIALWGLCLWTRAIDPLLSFALTIPTGLFLVRLFLIQHDCGHGSFLNNKKLQNQIGFGLGVLTLTPYQYWKKTHALHHSHSGNLDSKGEGEILTMTKKDFLNSSTPQQWYYRLYRNPVFLMTIGAAFQFGLKHRFPWDIPRSWKSEWKSIWGTNISLIVLMVATAQWIGWSNLLWIQIPVSMVASATGIFLFYVQHQYEEAYFRRSDEWNYHDAALQGSSHLILPTPLRWLTANIGLHHVHHLNHNIPNYKLNDCLQANPELVSGKSITIWEAFPLLKLSLYDEEKRCLISFDSLKTAS